MVQNSGLWRGVHLLQILALSLASCVILGEPLCPAWVLKEALGSKVQGLYQVEHLCERSQTVIQVGL